MDLLILFVVVYVIGTLVTALFWIIAYSDTPIYWEVERRERARKVLFSPIWPYWVGKRVWISFSTLWIDAFGR